TGQSGNFLVRWGVMRTINHVLQEIADHTVSYERCRKRVLGLFSSRSGDLVETYQKVSLKDPVSLMRIQVPIRGLNCQHLQCFDRRMYLTINFKNPHFQCPVCDKPLPAGDIVVDEFFAKILKDFPTASE